MSDTNRTCAYQYTVKRGDSFYLIAQRTGVNLRDLMDANPGIPASRLMVGDVLCIPYGKDAQTPSCEPSGGNTSSGCDDAGPSVPVPPCPPNRRTVVQDHQSAADLMLQYGLSYHTLQTANPDKDLESLRGGDILCIPEENAPCAVAATYTLKSGDTLTSAAQKNNVSVAALLRANPCLAPNDFCAGVTIRLPQ